MTEQTFDWRTETTRRGTVSRLARYVRDDCARCPERDVLVYQARTEDVLVCADCSRRDAVAVGKRQETCDNGDGRPAWRDPLSGKNEFYCAQCHGANGTVFQNRWADHDVREGRVLGIKDPARCELRNYGTDCKGEIKWRSAMGMEACNFHAGKKSANEANN